MSIRRASPTVSKRQTKVRRARCDILSGLIVFVLLQLILAVGIETCLPQVRDPLYGCRLARVRQRLRAAPVKPLSVVMLGSSRTRFGFRPIQEEAAWGEALGRPVAAFNFGVNGGGPLTELLTWRRLIRDGVRPNLLLVEVLPSSLGWQASAPDFREDYLPTDRLSWRDLPLIERYAGQVRPDLKRDWLRTLPMPWYAHRISLVSWAVPFLLPHAYRLDEAWKVDATGAMGFIQRPASPAERAIGLPLVRKAFQPSLTEFRLSGGQCRAVRELLSSCRQEGVPVVLVLMPEGPAFRSWYPPETWAKVREWLGQVSQEFETPLINAREWLDEDDFRDSNHLWERGADKFTNQLGRECVVPLLQSALRSSP